MADPLSEVIDQRAAFAQKFVSGTTNMAQRRRYQEDIQAAQDMEAAQVEQQRAFRMDNDPDFARTSIARDRLNMDRGFRTDAADLAEKRFMLESRIREDTAKMARDKAELDMDRIGLDIESKKMGLEDAKRITAESATAKTAWRDMVNRGLKPGNPEYAKGVMDLLVDNAHMEPNLRKSLVDTLRLDMDPDDLTFELEEGRANGLEPRITVREDAMGQKRRTITWAPKKDAAVDTEKEYNNVLKEWQEAVKLRAGMGEAGDNGKEKIKPGFSNDDLLLADEIKTRASKKLADLRAKSVSGGGANPEANAPAAGASAPVPTTTPAQPANLPTLTDKAQFDALPSGAQYYRNGTLYRKP